MWKAAERHHDSLIYEKPFLKQNVFVKIHG